MRRRPFALNEPLESDTLAYRSPTTEEAGRMKLPRLFAHYPKGEPVLLCRVSVSRGRDSRYNTYIGEGHGDSVTANFVRVDN